MKKLLAIAVLTVVSLAALPALSQYPGFAVPAPGPITNRNDPRFIQQIRGPVRLAIIAALIAPKKDDGNNWDAGGDPKFVPRITWTPELGDRLFRALLGPTPLDSAGRILPATAGAWDPMAAPDIELQVTLDGQQILTAPKVPDSYVPTWPERLTRPVIFNQNSKLFVNATDIDLEFDDFVGVCAIIGIPYENGQGYVLAQRGVSCGGGLWAVGLRVVQTQLE